MNISKEAVGGTTCVDGDLTGGEVASVSIGVAEFGVTSFATCPTGVEATPVADGEAACVAKSDITGPTGGGYSFLLTSILLSRYVILLGHVQHCKLVAIHANHMCGFFGLGCGFNFTIIVHYEHFFMSRINQ